MLEEWDLETEEKDESQVAYAVKQMEWLTRYGPEDTTCFNFYLNGVKYTFRKKGSPRWREWMESKQEEVKSVGV